MVHHDYFQPHYYIPTVSEALTTLSPSWHLFLHAASGFTCVFSKSNIFLIKSVAIYVCNKVCILTLASQIMDCETTRGRHLVAGLRLRGKGASWNFKINMMHDDNDDDDDDADDDDADDA